MRGWEKDSEGQIISHLGETYEWAEAVFLVMCDPSMSKLWAT